MFVDYPILGFNTELSSWAKIYCAIWVIPTPINQLYSVGEKKYYLYTSVTYSKHWKVKVFFFFLPETLKLS